VNIVWSGNARNDIKLLNAYISQDSPFYARQFIQRLLARVEGLQSFPSLGRRVPEVDREDIREIVFQGYRIIYQTTADHLLVITVLHGSRDLNNPSNRPWEG